MIVFVTDGRRKTTPTTKRKDVVTFFRVFLVGVLCVHSFYCTYPYLTTADITPTSATTSATATATATAIAAAATTTTRSASIIGSSNSNIAGSMSTKKLKHKNDNGKDDLLYLELTNLMEAYKHKIYLELTNLPEWEYLSEYEKDVQLEAYEQYKGGKATVEELAKKYMEAYEHILDPELTTFFEWKYVSENEKDIQMEAYEQWERKATLEDLTKNNDGILVLFFPCCIEWNYKDCDNLDFLSQENYGVRQRCCHTSNLGRKTWIFSSCE